MAKKRMKKCSPSPATKEMQIKTTLRFHLTPVRIAIIKNTTINRCWQWFGEKGTLVQCWWECKLVQPLWKTIWKLLKNLNIDLLSDPAIPLLGIYPKECDSGTPEAFAHPCLLQRYSQQPRCPTTDEWIKKTWLFIHNGILLSHEEEWTLIICR
jgi:hypothetical protein